MSNKLYFGDCLDVMKEHIRDESVDLIYLDPPFNSKRIYNASMGGAQWVAFKDTWHWDEAVDDFHETAKDPGLSKCMEGLRMMLGDGANLAYLSYMANRLRELRRVLKPAGSIYLHCDPTMSHYLKILLDNIFGRKNFRNEIIWHYYNIATVSKSTYGRKHDVIFFYAHNNNTFNYDEVREPYAPNSNWVKHGGYKNQPYTPHPKGKLRHDVWRIPSINNMATERVGYPTQKPLTLLKRIIQASSNPGDVIFDPFCGCGTTIHAAQDLDRQWIGIDVCVKACQVIEKRINEHFDSLWTEVEYIGMPKTEDDAHTMAEIDKFHFEKWAASLVPGMEANKKQRGDKGIDGWGRIAIRKGEFIDMVSQVKGGHTGRGDVQAFNGARHEAGADLGVFTCFNDRVTRGMRDATASMGRFMDYPRVQIYTIEDYFEGRKPNLPIAA